MKNVTKKLIQEALLEPWGEKKPLPFFYHITVMIGGFQLRGSVESSKALMSFGSESYMIINPILESAIVPMIPVTGFGSFEAIEEYNSDTGNLPAAVTGSFYSSLTPRELRDAIEKAVREHKANIWVEDFRLVAYNLIS